MYVYVGDHGSLRSLQGFLRRADCVAEEARAHELEVSVPEAPSERQARREVDIYLAIWQARNPGVEAYILDASRAPGTRHEETDIGQ